MRRILLAVLLGLTFLGLGPSARAQEASPAAVPAGTDWPTYLGSAARNGASNDPGPAGALELRWRHEIGVARSVASPAIAGGVVYAGSGILGSGAIVAIDLATGKRLWATELPDNVDYSSPAVSGGVVYTAGFKGSVFAIDAATGALRWQVQLGANTTSSPAVLSGTIYISADDDVLYALDAATGAQRWTFRAGSGPGYIIGPSPAVADGIVLTTTLDPEQDASIFAVDAASGEERWRFEPEGPGLATPAIRDGVVYVGGNDQHLYALNLATGDEVWRSEIGEVDAAPAVVDGMVFAHTDGALVALDAADGTVRWQAEIGGTWSAPVVAGGSVYVGGDGLLFEAGLFAFDAASGTLRWQLKGIGSIFSSPAIVADMVITGASDGALYAIGDTETTGPGSGRTSAGALIGPILLSTSADEFGRPIDAGTILPVGSSSLYAGFAFLDTVDGAQVHVTWLIDGAVVFEADGVWGIGRSGYGVESIVNNAGAFPPGHYEVVISIDGEEVRRGSVTLE